MFRAAAEGPLTLLASHRVFKVMKNTALHLYRVIYSEENLEVHGDPYDRRVHGLNDGTESEDWSSFRTNMLRYKNPMTDERTGTLGSAMKDTVTVFSSPQCHLIVRFIARRGIKLCHETLMRPSDFRT